MAHIPCPAADLPAPLPTGLTASTAMQMDEFASSCGGAGAPDMAFTFTAPADGPYTFDTFDSQLDTILIVLDEVCGGSELACDDDALPDGDSLIGFDMAAGQTVTVVVDGFGAFGDDFALTVREGPLTCPRADLGGAVPQTYSDNSALGTDTFAPSCVTVSGPDLGYLFTAPADGQFVFDTFGSSYNTVLHVLDDVCSGNELACNDTAFGAQAFEAGLVVPLTAGQTVTVVVDGIFGSAGEFDLSIGEVTGTCPDGNLAGVPAMTSGSTTSGQNTTVGSCGGLSAADETFVWTPPADGLYRFSTEGSAFDTALYLRDGGCAGAELACNDNAEGGTDQSQIAAFLSAGQTVAVTVDGVGQASGDFVLVIDEVICPAADLGGGAPLSQAGTTSGEPGVLGGSCGGGSAPEFTYTWTAPFAAEFGFDTFGSAYDTVLYLLDGSTCADTELVCDDDTAGAQSAVAQQMIAGQTVVVVVDGFATSAGAYTLNIAELTCPDADIGNASPDTVLGSTLAEFNEHAASCGGTTAPDAALRWTAPASGDYVFDTAGSNFDTVLYLRDADCAGPELACDDDALGIQSQLTATLAAGQTVVIFVDGFLGGSVGDYVLNIDEM